MKGKVIDKNAMDAFVNLENGDIKNIPLSSLPKDVKIGDGVEVSLDTGPLLTSHKPVDFF